MNRTLIVLVTLSLGALLPAPAQAGQFDLSTICVNEILDSADEAVDDAQDAIVPFVQAASAAMPDDVCLAVDPCPAESYGAVVNGQDRCVNPNLQTPDCVPGTMTTSADWTGGSTDCPVKPCPKGEIGLQINGAEGCRDGQAQVPNCVPATVGAFALAGGDCPIQPKNPPPPGEECKKTEDDNGFGGTHVYCRYDCMTGDQLGIYVEAHDKSWGKAEADGDTACGGTTADCDVQSPDKTICTGASGVPATRNEQGIDCHGESHEAFDDAVTVACYSVGVSTICKILTSVPECNQGWSVSSGSTTSNMAISACIANLPLVLSSDAADERAAWLLQTLPLSVGSFTAFEVDANGGFAIGATAARGPLTCWAQWL
jgi:hypothetical protein